MTVDHRMALATPSSPDEGDLSSPDLQLPTGRSRKNLQVTRLVFLPEIFKKEGFLSKGQF
jgi:hypothetical protein